MCRKKVLHTFFGAVSQLFLHIYTYDANVIWYANHKTKRVSPYIGIGFKHINSHMAGIPNYNGVYVTAGIKF